MPRISDPTNTPQLSQRNNLIRRSVQSAICLAVLASIALPVMSQQDASDLTTQSLEQLMDIQVTSASKKSEDMSAAPAAIFVITGEDIRRGGFSSIPDALRMAPGLHVAQQSAHVWQVAARGLGGVFNHEMLVLVDGRLAYTPLFGGVWWDIQDPLLEDIDRIEVIRGPGGTLWGANAVNGVINIIMKKSEDTQGALASTSAGVDEGYAGRVRFGGRLGNATYRIYGTSNDWLPSVNAAGIENYDTWSISQGGVRLDWNTSSKDDIMFDGQGYSGRTRDLLDVFSPSAAPAEINSDSVMKGGHVLAHWAHTFNERSATDVLGYCDWTDRNETGFIEPRSICDVEFQHNYSLTDRQSLTWGAAVMTTHATEQESFTTGFTPRSDPDTTSSVFLQYDIRLVPNKLRVIAGSKFEHNSYTGFEYQPQIRAVWTPTKSQSVWAAISRVVRTPAVAERDLRNIVAEVSTAPPTFLVLTGNPNLKAEAEHAYEAGYRYEWNQRFSLDAAAYYNDFNRLIGNGATGAPIVNPSPFYIDLPVPFANLGSGQTHGMELYLSYSPARRWTVSTGITELRGNSVPGVVAGVGDSGNVVGGDPRQQVTWQSKLDLTRHLNFDATYYYYDAIPQALPPVNRVDVGMSTKPIHEFTFSVWGRNLQADRHQEAAAFVLPAGEIRRSVVFKMTWESESEKPTAKP
jgi:iron complex outermembrane recepter protein